jgi:ACS family pantothenate transporter-like MFS transporter
MSFQSTVLHSLKRKEQGYTSLSTKDYVAMGQLDGSMEERAVDQGEASVVQKDVKKKWVSYIWDTFDKSPEERRFLTKLDAAILTFASLGKHEFPIFILLSKIY